MSSVEPTNARIGHVDVGERDGAAVDDEAAREHAVVDDELVDERRGAPGPGHATKPSPPRKRRRASRFSSALAVVELAHEVDALLDLLARR